MIGGIHCPITLKEDTHTYHHEDGDVYASLSQLRKEVQHPFDAEIVSRSMAASALRKQGIAFDNQDVEASAAAIRREWQETGDYSMAKGTELDSVITTFFQSGQVSIPSMQPLLNAMWKLMEGYKQRNLKTIVWSEDHGVAGELDINGIRKKNIMDIYDYKVAVRKKIEYISKDNKFLKEPLAHLEQCSYTDYALQLSTYALMAEICYKVVPGKLTLIQFYVDNFTKYKLIPVPYMKYEAWALLENHRKQTNSNF